MLSPVSSLTRCPLHLCHEAYFLNTVEASIIKVKTIISALCVSCYNPKKRRNVMETSNNTSHLLRSPPFNIAMSSVLFLSLYREFLDLKGLRPAWKIFKKFFEVVRSSEKLRKVGKIDFSFQYRWRL